MRSVFNKIALFVGGVAAMVGVGVSDSQAALPVAKAKEITITEQTPLILTQPGVNANMEDADFQAWHSSHQSHYSHSSHSSHRSHYSSRW